MRRQPRMKADGTAVDLAHMNMNPLGQTAVGKAIRLTAASIAEILLASIGDAKPQEMLRTAPGADRAMPAVREGKGGNRVGRPQAVNGYAEAAAGSSGWS